MDFLTQQKFMKWVIAVLIILNISTLAFLWATRSAPPEPRIFEDDQPGRLGDGRIMRFFQSELNLSDEQSDAILKLREEHRKNMRPILKEIHLNKKLIIDGIFDGTEVNVDSIAGEIGALQAQMEVLTYDHLNKLKNILGPDQKENFKKFVSGFFLNVEKFQQRRMSPHNRSRGPGPPSWH